MFNDDGIPRKGDLQEIETRMRSEFRAIGLERYNLLVELRLLQNKEKEIAEREFVNWLLNEVDRCDSMQGYVTSQVKISRKSKKAHRLGDAFQQDRELVDGVDEIVSYCNNCKHLLGELL